MVVYRELRIAPDSRSMLVDIEVAPYSYYDNLVIDEVRVDTDETFVGDSPSSASVCLFSNDYSEPLKHVSLSLCADDLKVDSLSGHVFYLYTSCSGAIAPDIPCMMDVPWTMGVVIDWRPIYKKGMFYVRKVIDIGCDIPKAFIDFSLRFDAFQIALNEGQYDIANKLFRRWFASSDTEQTSDSDCGCR